jgi:hypothetical protein
MLVLDPIVLDLHHPLDVAVLDDVLLVPQQVETPAAKATHDGQGREAQSDLDHHLHRISKASTKAEVRAITQVKRV